MLKKASVLNKKYLSYYLLYIIGFIFLAVPWLIITLIFFIIISPLFLITGEVPDWVLKIRDAGLFYFGWLDEHYRKSG